MTKNKIGILKYIAATGARGVKFEDQPETWYNPANDEAKEMVKDEYKGKQVEIILAEGKKTEFTSMVVLETMNKAVKKLKKAMKEPESVVETETIGYDEQLDEQLGTTEEGVPTGASHVPKEEKVPQTPPKEEEIDHALIYGESPIEGLINKIRNDVMARQYTKEVYAEMEQTKLETATKGPYKLTYASWAEAYGALKRVHPTAQFKVHENENSMPVFYNKDTPSMGAFVKVSVTVMGLTHTVHLPVMDHSNKSIAIGSMTTFDINKNIQRALAKAIALHGMGLYVFKGEDYPEDTPNKK